MSVKDAIEGFWAAHKAGDHEALKKVLDQDFTWTVVGRTCPIAKTYHGWDGFLGELLGGLATAFRPGSLNMKLLGSYADEAQGVGILHLFETATTQGGVDVEHEIVDIFQVRDGKIVEVREIMDLAEVNNAFGFGNGEQE
ncbi:nuclear transport factor 2 family protein [Shinella sp. PSBB067]|uniref:nuclear transport factor 2 family protein n=1 Tax=Shinella sp. PSBB067 TaxID=2715959 RepID=UPI00193C1F05|nr:nuclear transport factor 2 family protein [Shinella sp. PSBB067]QRI63884.1 nuclear transport factor 2 family protein [Shinella sp. PSBB067]